MTGLMPRALAKSCESAVATLRAESGIEKNVPLRAKKIDAAIAHNS